MIRELFFVIALINATLCRLRHTSPCLETEDIKRPFVKKINFTDFSRGTWYDIYACEHAFNLKSKCVRTTFLRTDYEGEEYESEELQKAKKILVITNFVDRIGLLTRVYGVAKVNEESNGFAISYFAIPKLSIEFSVLDVVYSEYALLHACVNKRNVVWIVSRNRHLHETFIERAVTVIEENGLPLTNLFEIEQSCNFPSYFQSSNDFKE